MVTQVQNLGRLSFVTIMSKLLIVLGKIQIAMVASSPAFLYGYSEST